MRSSTGGWVENNPAIQDEFFFLSGLLMKRWAIEEDAFFIWLGYVEIFSNAEASPAGFRVMRTPEASAKNSLFLEIASCMRVATMGVSIITTTNKRKNKGL